MTSDLIISEQCPMTVKSNNNKISIKLLKAIDIIFIIILTAIFLARLGLIIFGEQRNWVELIIDDAYYYLGIARNIADHGSSTFLPPFSTNGYQPLWLLILSTTGFLFGTSETSLLIQIVSLSFFFTGAFAYTSKKYYGFAFPAIVTALLSQAITLYGMETTMLPVFILIFFKTQDWKARGGLASLIFLSRLDALALVVARDCFHLFFKKECNFRHYFIIIPVITIYLFINYKIFSSPVPVSGLSKAVGNIAGENLFLISFYFLAPNLKNALFLLIAVSAIRLLFRQNITFQFKNELIILVIANIAICTYYSTLSGWPSWHWYGWPAMMIFYFSFMHAILFLTDSLENIIKQKTTKIFLYLILSPPALCILYISFPVATSTWQFLGHYLSYFNNKGETFGIKNLQLADFIKKNYAKGTYFAMGDRAGSFGFFLGNDYKFLHTEGLVGSRTYYDYMMQNRGDQFMREQKVNYLIVDRDGFLESGDILGIIEPIQGLSSHTGPYLLCFNKNSIVLNQSYLSLLTGVESKRYMFDSTKEISCPKDMIENFKALRNKYGSVRYQSLYAEYPHQRGVTLSILAKFFNLPTGW